ncbi:hypothetical protein ACERNI_17815 [Camelimonas sp. ID_303_24]
MAAEQDDYLLGTCFGMKMAINALILRYVATSKDPSAEIAELNDYAHRLLTIERLVAKDPLRSDKKRSIAEATLDDIVGNLGLDPE